MPGPALLSQTPGLEAPAVDADLDALLTALYVEIDDHVIGGRRGPGRPRRLSDAGVACLPVAQVLLGFASERRWLRFARTRLGHLFPYLPHQPGYHKRLKAAAPLLAVVIDHLARQAPCWHDQVRLIDATPLPCGTPRETAKRSDLAGWAGVRVLRLPLPLLPGAEAIRDRRPGRNAGGLAPGQPEIGNAR